MRYRVTRDCAECGTSFVYRRIGDLFCSTKCRKTMHNREMIRGRLVYRVAYWWRKGRGQGDAKGMFQEMCRVIDEWHAEDHEKKLPRPPKHVRRDSRFMMSRPKARK